ncbi:energy transducer TonB [Brucepastera parasyntrophica]|uniref:energy transducer TonB n=1 Tax=Brucepastera parasyntrophica TaxID=2880008 RepID=UPI00210A35ED|nr:energy transducer TonB [Brucepastera parasyntrophica]ULQ59207.1 energy transducer TonB [Brucepastera parasyntrophica]
MFHLPINSDRKRLLTAAVCTLVLFTGGLLFSYLLPADLLRKHDSLASVYSAVSITLSNSPPEGVSPGNAKNPVYKTEPARDLPLESSMSWNLSAQSPAEEPGFDSSYDFSGDSSDIPENPSGPGFQHNSESSTENGISIGAHDAGKNEFFMWLDAAIRTRLNYPERARRRNIEGTVFLLVSVSPGGETCRVSVSESSGSALLDAHAIQLVESLFPSPLRPGKEYRDVIKITYFLK